MPQPALRRAVSVSPRPLPTRDRFVRAASLALAGAVLGQGEDGLVDVSDLHELADLLRAVLYDEGVMPA
jgi:hypothetical protein